MRTVALIVALALGIAAAVGVAMFLKSQERDFQDTHRMVSVAVARRSLKAGDVLTAEAVGFEQTPVNSMSQQDISMGGIKAFYGEKVNRNIDKGSRIQESHFLSREARPASNVLPEGWRAIAVSVDATSGVAGLIRPGDHVDIHATTTGRGTAGRADAETWLVLSDVTVLAVDDRMSDVSYGVMDSRGYGRGYSSLVLAVTPPEAQLLTYLKDHARLTFALRPRGELGQKAPAARISGDNVRQLAEQANAERQRVTGELEDRRTGQ